MKKILLAAAILTTLNPLFAQKPITTIPFQLFGDHIMIEVSLDDSEPLNFIFDSGSSLTGVDEDITQEMGLEGKLVDMNTPGMEWKLIKHNTIAINHFLMEKNIKVYATDFDHLEVNLGIDIDGIIGYDLLKHHALNFDFDKKLMSVYPLGEGPTDGEEVSFTLQNSIPTIKGKVVLNNGEAIETQFLWITGAGTTFDFNAPFARQWDVINKTGRHYSYLVKGITEKETLYYEGHLESFHFGNQSIENLPIGISTSEVGIQSLDNTAGIIGSQIIRMYNFTIDYGTKKMYLQKDKTYNATFNTNCAGLDVQLAEDKKTVLIHEVFSNSPASEAGIKIEDELLEINGLSMANIDLPDIKKLLRQEGKSVSLVIKQQNKEKSLTLQLRSLIN